MLFSSNTAPGTHAVERRVPSPSCVAARRWKGWQRSVRYAEEGRRVFGGGPTRRVVGLVLCVLVGSLVDALLTLEHLRRGGSEANPLMALALTYGPTAFLGLKMGCLVWGLGYWQRISSVPWRSAVYTGSQWSTDSSSFSMLSSTSTRIGKRHRCTPSA